MAPQQQQQEHTQQQQQSQQQPPNPPPTTARDELSRLAAHLEFRTRDLRRSVSTSLGFPPDPPTQIPQESAASAPADPDPEEDLFAPIGYPSEGWTEVSEYALDVPEDLSAQRSAPAAPPGPLEEASRAALRAVGLTGRYLEAAVRVVGGTGVQEVLRGRWAGLMRGIVGERLLAHARLLGEGGAERAVLSADGEGGGEVKEDAREGKSPPAATDADAKGEMEDIPLDDPVDDWEPFGEGEHLQ